MNGTMSTERRAIRGAEAFGTVEGNAADKATAISSARFSWDSARRSGPGCPEDDLLDIRRPSGLDPVRFDGEFPFLPGPEAARAR